MELWHPMSEAPNCPKCGGKIVKLFQECQFAPLGESVNYQGSERYKDWERSESVQYKVKHRELAYEKDLR